MGGAPTCPKGDAVMAGKKNHVIGTRERVRRPADDRVTPVSGVQAPSTRSSDDGFHSSPTAIVRPGRPGASTVVSPSASAATT